MKKIIILLIGLALLVGSVSAFAGGSGSLGDPYQISDCTELQAMNTSFTAHYELINDIDCSDTINWNGGEGFIPIGYLDWDSVSGGLDGNGYTVSDLFMNKSDGDAIGLVIYIDGGSYYLRNIEFNNLKILGDSSSDYIGLISYVESGSNLTLENIIVDEFELSAKGFMGTFYAGGNSDYVIARNLIARDGYITTLNRGYTGGAFGYLDEGNALISNVSVENVTIDIKNTAFTYGRVGGLIGHAFIKNDFSINQASATGQIISSENGGGSYDPYNIGGIIGLLQPQTGQTTINFTNIYSQININLGNNSYNVGGIIGYVQNNVLSSENMEYVYYAGELTAGGSGIGGITGNSSSLISNTSTIFWDTELSGVSYSDIGAGKTTTEMKTTTTWSAFDTDIWFIEQDEYPIFYHLIPQAPIIPQTQITGYVPNYDAGDLSPAMIDMIMSFIGSIIIFAGLIAMILLGSWGLKKIKGNR